MSRIQVKTDLKFDSYKEVQQFIRNYEIQEKEKFRRATADKLKTNSYKTKVNENLIYSRIIFLCKFGNGYQPKGTGQRKTRFAAYHLLF